MASSGIMSKNQGPDTKIFGIEDHLFRRRVDQSREQGDVPYAYPIGQGAGTRSCLSWHSEPKALPYVGRKHFPQRVLHKRLGFQEKTSLQSREATPEVEHRVSQRYQHLKKSSVFPFDDVKQKHTPADPRNGIGEVSPGDKSYDRPEGSPGYFSPENSCEGSLRESSSRASSSRSRDSKLPEGHMKWQQRHIEQDIKDVADTEQWAPATPLTPLTAASCSSMTVPPTIPE